MDSQSKYKEKTLRFVNIVAENPADAQGAGGVDAFTYGFSTNIKQSDATELGHVTLNLASPPNRLIIGASSPKPMRASKRQGTGASAYYCSSFCDVTKRLTLKNAGWQVTRSKRNSRIINAESALVQTVFVTVRGIKYAWHRNKVTVTNATAAKMASLGHMVPTAADASELVFGAEFPKPPKAAMIIPGASADDGPKRITAFYDPSGTLANGWTPAGNGKLFL